MLSQTQNRVPIQNSGKRNPDAAEAFDWVSRDTFGRRTIVSFCEMGQRDTTPGPVVKSLRGGED